MYFSIVCFQQIIIYNRNNYCTCMYWLLVLPSFFIIIIDCKMVSWSESSYFFATKRCIGLYTCIYAL